MQRPEFAFENGKVFSLDLDEGCILNDFEVKDYKLEEEIILEKR